MLWNLENSRKRSPHIEFYHKENETGRVPGRMAYLVDVAYHHNVINDKFFKLTNYFLTIATKGA